MCTGWVALGHFSKKFLSSCKKQIIGLMSRVFAKSSRDRGSVPGRVIPKTQKMVLNITLLRTQYYKVRIKGKVEHRPPLQLGDVAIEKGAFRSPSTKVANFTYIFIVSWVCLPTCKVIIFWIGSVLVLLFLLDLYCESNYHFPTNPFLLPMT